jgi:hypothetical protein
MQFKDVSENEAPVVEEILQESGATINFEWKTFLPDNIKLITIKDHVAGLMFKNHIVVKHVVLRPYFQDQGISREIVESYFFI